MSPARIVQHDPLLRFVARIRTANVTKYALRSVPALMTSVIVFAVLDWAGIRTGIDCAAAFAAGAVPDWRLNRELWPLANRGAWARETSAFTSIAVLAWGVSTWATGHAQDWAQVNGGAGDLHRLVVTTAAYAAVQAAFFAIKFLIFDN